MSFFVPAFVLAVVLVPATLVPVVVMVPAMVMLDTPVRTVPVASVVAASCVVWNVQQLREAFPFDSAPQFLNF